METNTGRPTARLLRTVTAIGGALGLYASSHALSLNLEADQTEIVVGDAFSVSLFAEFDAAYELVYFAFDVEAPGSLLPQGLAQFTGWSVAPPLLEGFTFGPTEVAGLGDFLNPLVGGGSSLLATLNFQAIGAGAETVSIAGLSSDFMGISLYDPISDQSIESDIDLSLEVDIERVPDSSSWAAFPVALGALLILRRRMGRWTAAGS